MSLNASVAAIIENPEWLKALHQWHNAGCHTLNGAAAPFGLTPQSWMDLKIRLQETGWFQLSGESITPQPEAQEFLYRARELSNLMELDARGKTPPLLFTEKAEGAAVDIGCGPGYALVLLARLGYEPLYGYDLSPFALEIAEYLLTREGKEACLIARDATPLAEIPDGEAALIYSRGALHYFNLEHLARSVGRVLRPGGHVVVEVKALSQYSQFLKVLRRRGWRKAAAYGMVFFRTLLFEIARRQPYLGAKTQEIGWTRRTIRHFAHLAGLETLSCVSNPSFKSYDIVFRKTA